MNVLECKNLKKAYKKGNFVLDNFNIRIPKGKIIGLLGPNGCGKSTLIKLIAGLLQPNEGEITVCGIPVGEQTKAMISYLPERPYFNGSMTVNELMYYFKEFYADFDDERAYRLLADLGIDHREEGRNRRHYCGKGRAGEHRCGYQLFVGVAHRSFIGPLAEHLPHNYTDRNPERHINDA